MGGKAELVKYTRLFEKGPLSAAQKKKLKEEIGAIIDAASNSMTIVALVEPITLELRKALDEAEKKGGGY